MTYCGRVKSEIKSGAFWRDVLAEGVATLVLVAVQCALLLTWGGDKSASLIQTAVGMGFVVALLIESFSQYGGAHMNPAVTVSMLICNKVTVTRAFLYIVVQCCFAIGGAGLIYVVTPAGRRERLAATTLDADLAPWQGVVVEAFLTFIIASTVHGATNADRKDVYMPSLPIGFSVTTTILAGAHHTGASMNCARTLGPAVIMNIWEHHWVYWAGPMLGGIVAAILHHYGLDRVGKKELKGKTNAAPVEPNTWALTDCFAGENDDTPKYKCVCKFEG